MSPGDGRLRDLLQHVRRRLALLDGCRRAGWLLLIGVIALELGWLGRGPFPIAAPLVLTLGALFLTASVGALLNTPPPSLVVAGEVLDARLATGATIASGAEALGGSHGRFGRALVEEAERATAGARASELLPFQAPAGVLLGLAAAALFPFVAAPGAMSSAAPLPALPSLLDPAAAAGGGPTDADAAADEAPGWDLVEGSPPTSVEPEPWDALPLDVAERLRAQLEALLEALPPGGAGGDGSEAGSGSAELDDALARGDTAAIEREAERLAERAAGGDQAARAALDRLADGLAPAGSGASEDVGATSAPPAPEDGEAVAQKAERLPWALEEACRRYLR